MAFNWRQNVPLLVGLAIPVLMVVAIFATIYTPRLLAKPNVNFVYAVGNYPIYDDYSKSPAERHLYQVSNDTVTMNTSTLDTKEATPYDPYYVRQSAPTFYRYDVTKRQGQELSWEDVQKIHIDKNDTSADGWHVEQGNRNGSIFDLFGSSSTANDWFLVGHNASLQLDLPNVNRDEPYYYGDQGFHFIGWIK